MMMFIWSYVLLPFLPLSEVLRVDISKGKASAEIGFKSNHCFSPEDGAKMPHTRKLGGWSSR